MTQYYGWKVNLTDEQKIKLANSIKNKCSLTLRVKYSNLKGDDFKISKAQIRKMAKHGGNLFSSLATLGAKVLPYAVKGVSKAVPALATGAVSTLGSLGIDKIFGKGINIPKKYFPMLPMIVNELTQPQIDQINKVTQTGGRPVLKPIRKQIEGGLLGTLASIGIPMAISLVSKMFGGGLQVDKAPQIPKKMSNVYLPQEGGQFPLYPPPFYGNWNDTIGMGKKLEREKKISGERIVVKKKQPVQRNSSSGRHPLNKAFVNKALSNFDLEGWINHLGIKHFRSIYSRSRLPNVHERMWNNRFG